MLHVAQRWVLLAGTQGLAAVEEALLNLRDAMPFAKLLGIELLEASPEVVRGRLGGRPSSAPPAA